MSTKKRTPAALSKVVRILLVLALDPEADLVEGAGDDGAEHRADPVDPLVGPEADDDRGPERPRGVHAAPGERHRRQMGHADAQAYGQGRPALAVVAARVRRTVHHQHQEERHDGLDQDALAAAHVGAQGRHAQALLARLRRDHRLWARGSRCVSHELVGFFLGPAKVYGRGSQHRVTDLDETRGSVL